MLVEHKANSSKAIQENPKRYERLCTAYARNSIHRIVPSMSIQPKQAKHHPIELRPPSNIQQRYPSLHYPCTLREKEKTGEQVSSFPPPFNFSPLHPRNSSRAITPCA